MKLEHIYYFDQLKSTQEINQIRDKWTGLPDLDPIKDGYPDGMQKYCQQSSNDLILSNAIGDFNDRNDVRNWLSDQVDKYKKFWDEDEKDWLEHTQNTLERSIYITPVLRNNEMYQLIFKWCDEKLKDFDLRKEEAKSYEALQKVCLILQEKKEIFPKIYDLFKDEFKFVYQNGNHKLKGNLMGSIKKVLKDNHIPYTDRWIDSLRERVNTKRDW